MHIFRLPMIWYAISLHYMYGFLLLFGPEKLQAVAILGGFDALLKNIGLTATAILLIAVATIAVFGLLAERRISESWSIACLFPQYIVLLLALTNSIVIILDDFYVESARTGEMVRVPWVTLVYAVGPIALAAFWHTFAILYRIKIGRKEREDEEYIQKLRDRVTELEVQLYQVRKG